MSDSLVPFLISVGLFGVFWLFIYCYLLYRLGRSIAVRYRTRSTPVFIGIAMVSAALSISCLFLPVDVLGKSALVFAVWITHTQGVGWGFWAGMEIGKNEDEIRFKQKAEEWLREWEEPVNRRPSE